MAVLAQLDARPVGNMIMSQLQIHLAAEGVVDDIISLVNQLIADTEADQASADQQHSADKQECATEIGNADKKHNQHIRERDNCFNTIKETQGLQATAEAEHAATVDKIAELEKLISEGTALRAKQAAAYKESQKKHQKAIDALGEAVKIIGNLMRGGSWIQLKSKVERVTESLKSLGHLKQFDAYGPIIQQLVEISSENKSRSKNAIQDILNLLTKLRVRIQKVKDDETAVEKSRISSWAKQLATLRTQRANAVTRKGNLEANISNYKSIIVNNQKAAAMHDKEQARFADLRDDWKNTCAERNAAYKSTTASRNADLDVLRELAEYLAKNVPAMEDYLMERVNK
jgi:hypothetical protein